MNGFDDRLRVQKFIYLLQTFDIYLGYDFSWYLRGPYCSTLAATCFALEEMYNKIPDDEKIKFVDAKIQKRFEDFGNFINGRMNDIKFLEIAASLHYLKKICTLSEEDIIKKVIDKQPDFTEVQVRRIDKELKKWPLI